MPMFRHAVVLLGAGTALALAAPAAAQDNSGVMGILVECAKIDDPSARLACYDNNMRAAGATARTTVPRRGSVTGGGAPVTTTGSAGTFGADDLRAAPQFGSEDIRTPERFRAPPGPSEIVATVARAQMREPGVYLMTMRDDTQWVFAHSVRDSFRTPRAGSKVEIRRGALGSYIASVDGQETIQVRRVR